MWNPIRDENIVSRNVRTLCEMSKNRHSVNRTSTLRIRMYQCLEPFKDTSEKLKISMHIYEVDYGILTLNFSRK